MSDSRSSDHPEPVDPYLLRRLAADAQAKTEIATATVSTAAGASPTVVAGIDEALAEIGPSLVGLSHDLAEHPELAFDEHRSSAALATLVESFGIEVARGPYDLPTAMRAEFGGRAGEGPTVALLSEYDALPGIGHGCGHNLIATAGVGAFLALARVRDQLPGRVVWMGTPAEEGGSGKELMARRGAFDDVDASIMVHPFTYDTAEPIFLGRRQLQATFTGLPAHASAQPFMGRNALDAANLMYAGVSANRQQMPPTDRVHAIFTDGGERPNVIPERAGLLFYVRSQYPQTLHLLSERLTEIAHGAALMAGCSVELEWDPAPPYLPMRNNSPLAHVWNRRYGDRGHQVLPPGVVPELLAGSTDFGNISFRLPGLHPMIKIAEPELSLHTREFAAAAVTPTADAVLVDAAAALAATAADYLADGDLQQQVRDDFDAAGGALDVPHFFD